jgi:prephenate dehydratase
LRVAFLGPAGTFTDEALRASAPGEVEAVELPTVHETVMAVQRGDADLAVVPIENSLEGGVAATLDALAGEAQDVRIAGELVHPVSHCLVAARPLELDDVERVVSHPQATAQCAAFLRERLPGADRVDVGSTAEAVRQVVAADGLWAALASRLAADLYGAEVLAEGVEDRPENRTRFVWLRSADTPSPFGDDGPLKTSIVFWGAGDETPGWLVRVLGELAGREVNLTRIESRPRRVRLGHYMFFCDLEGGESDPAVAEALEAVAGHVEAVRVLGSYPGVSRVDER